MCFSASSDSHVYLNHLIPTNQSIQLQCFSCLRRCMCMCVCVCVAVYYWVYVTSWCPAGTRGGRGLICNVACKWPRHLVTPVRIQFYISAWYWAFTHWQVMTGYSTKCAWLMIYCGYFVKIWEGVEQDRVGVWSVTEWEQKILLCVGQEFINLVF